MRTAGPLESLLEWRFSTFVPLTMIVAMIAYTQCPTAIPTVHAPSCHNGSLECATGRKTVKPSACVTQSQRLAKPGNAGQPNTQSEYVSYVGAFVSDIETDSGELMRPTRESIGKSILKSPALIEERGAELIPRNLTGWHARAIYEEGSKALKASDVGADRILIGCTRSQSNGPPPVGRGWLAQPVSILKPSGLREFSTSVPDAGCVVEN